MGTKIRCLKCGSVVEGDRKGHCIDCSCGACFIDETPYYVRIGGNAEDIQIQDKDGNWISAQPEEKPKPERISKINYYLNIAEAASERSTCLKRHYGAVIVKDDEIIATGYNGAPRGLPSCLDCNECYREGANRGEDYSHCKAVHAEQNAIISARRKDMIGADIYIVGKEVPVDKDLPETYVENPAPCSLCKRMIINSGINLVFVRTSLTEYEVGAVKDWKIDDITGGY